MYHNYGKNSLILLDLSLHGGQHFLHSLQFRFLLLKDPVLVAGRTRFFLDNAAK